MQQEMRTYNVFRATNIFTGCEGLRKVWLRFLETKRSREWYETRF